MFGHDRCPGGALSEAAGAVSCGPAGTGGSGWGGPLGGSVRAQPAVEWRTEIHRAVGNPASRGKRAGHAAVHWAESVGVEPRLGAIRKTNDGRVGSGSGLGGR